MIAVDTGLTQGRTKDVNNRYLVTQLERLGLMTPWQLTVADDRDRIQTAIAQAQQQAHLVIIWGDLGEAMMTAIAAALGCGLVADQAQGLAYSLVGSQVLKNPLGGTPGLYQAVNDNLYVILPGTPADLAAVVTTSLLPRLRQLGWGGENYWRRLYFVGWAPAQLVSVATQAVDDDRVTITAAVQPTAVQLGLSWAGMPKPRAQAVLDAAATRVQAALAPYYIGTGDGLTLAEQVVQALAARGQTVTGAESLTGGLFQATLCGVPGASQVFKGGFVTYAAEAKERLIGVPAATIATAGVVSAATAAAMASGCRQRLAADFGLAFTGVAGPASLEGHPAGTVWLGLAERGQSPVTQRLHLSGLDRQAVRQQSVQAGLLLLYHRLQK